MPIHNSDVAEIFNRIADFLEIKGENPFRIRAYRDAARTIGGLSKSAADLVEQGKDLSALPGIGKDLADKIKEIVETGTLPLLRGLEKELPPELPDLMKIQGMGPKKVKGLFKELGIESVGELKKAAEQKKIQKLHGFGKRTEENILEELGRIKEQKGAKQRIKLAVAEQIAEPLLEYLIFIATDAHRIDDLDLMRFGIGQARRGWLEPGDVLNTRKWEELKRLLQRK
jgi:DNA polymerase (family 10)